MEEVKRHVRNSGQSEFSEKECTWIKATVPRQAKATMDCGICMSMYMAKFAQALAGLSGEDTPGGALPYDSVVIAPADHTYVEDDSYVCSEAITPKMLGWFGRAHMRQSLIKKSFPKKAVVFSMLDVTFGSLDRDNALIFFVFFH